MIKNNEYLSSILDFLPVAIFLVDEQYKIFDMNKTAAALIDNRSKSGLNRLCGQILHCMHALASEGGCGTTKSCHNCVFRMSVKAAFKGDHTQRATFRMAMKKKGKYTDLHLLVTARPFEYAGGDFALVILEDITELVTLRKLLPICIHCKKIRNDDNYWEEVSSYLREHANLHFTHGICPECQKKHYAWLEK